MTADPSAPDGFDAAALAALDSLSDFVTRTRAAVREIAAVTAAGLAASPSPRREDLHGLQAVVRRRLGQRPDLLHGGGFVARPGLLEDAAWWLEWFAWDTSGSVQRLVPETDPDGSHFFDYTVMPWYADATTDMTDIVTGPYVDYLCTDDYTLTFTCPVVVDADSAPSRPRPVDTGDSDDARDPVAGVAGIDVRVMALEERFLGPLRASARTLVLVNRLGRITMSNSARLLSGNLLDVVDVPALFADPVAHPDLAVIAHSELGLLDLGPR